MINYYFLGFDKKKEQLRHEIKIDKDVALKIYRDHGNKDESLPMEDIEVNVEVVKPHSNSNTNLILEDYDWYLGPAMSR